MGNLFGKSKTLIIMRGLPGSGKTTLARKLAKDYGVILSSNDYFIEDGVYKFDHKKLRLSHMWNQERTKKAMEKNETLIIIDNVNIRKFEAKPYVELGLKYNYNIEILETETPWRYNIDELMKRDIHSIPKRILKNMKRLWENDFTVNNILNSKFPWKK